MTSAVQRLSRARWRKVRGPRTWRPKHKNEELIGFYGGRTVKNGRFGQYEVIMVHAMGEGTFMVSGTKIIQLIDAAVVSKGDAIRIVWLGLRHLEPTADGEPRTMKDFELYVDDSEPLTEDEMASVAEEANAG